MPKEKTVPVHARLPQADADFLNAAATRQKPFPVTRSTMIAIIVREWIERQQPPKKSR